MNQLFSYDNMHDTYYAKCKDHFILPIVHSTAILASYIYIYLIIQKESETSCFLTNCDIMFEFVLNLKFNYFILLCFHPILTPLYG